MTKWITKYCDDISRFKIIIDEYLSKLEEKDLDFITGEDLINLVPSDNYKHKLLMIILIKRYLKK